MANHSERYDKSEFETTARILLDENDGNLKKINANMVAKRMGRLNANNTAYNLFDEWATGKRFGRHIGNFSISPDDEAKLDDVREQLKGMLIGIGSAITGQANRNTELQLSDLKEEVAGLREDRNILLDVVESLKSDLDTANKKMEALESGLEVAQNATAASKGCFQ